MKKLPSILFVALFPLVSLSCTRDAMYTIAATPSGMTLVAQDKETMERIIECAITGKCVRLSVMQLLPSRKVFLVEAGTKIAVERGLFSFSGARKVRVLEGEHSGQDGWVYDRTLCQDRSSVPYQLAIARIYGTDGK
jgi:hypothetical protein